ncbi:MAG TPA: radical SAM protein [Bacteroidota bacterium]|nr:radical SAM protein [Bacteroidota bacterium]
MDLLLTHAYFLYEDKTEKEIMKPYPVLGILYISAYLKSKGFDVRVFDTTFKMKQDFYQYIDHQRPTIVGIYINLMTKLNALKQIRYCKQHGCTVIVGGPDVPEYAEEYVQFGADVAVIGEGERTMEELLPALVKRTPLRLITGIVFRNEDGNIVRTGSRPLIQDLDSIPNPDRDAIDISAYIKTWRIYHGMGSVSLICARGCPFTCTWCSRSVFGETHRRRSVKSVVDEIELLREKYNPDMLWFADDVFTIHHKWFNEFYDEMKRRKISIPFECISRADRLNEDILKKMAELGSFRIWYGSESGSQRILDAMQRHVSVDEIRRITKLAQKYGIQAGIFVMLGYPGESIADIEQTVEHLKLTQANSFLTTVAYPIKGTQFYGDIENQILNNTNWQHITDRNLSFKGRFSKCFYWFANRYLTNEVLHTKSLSNGSKLSLTRSIAFLKAKTARLGMTLTRGLLG